MSAIPDIKPYHNIFRGQSNPDKPLIASAHRPAKPGQPHRLAAFVPQVPRVEIPDRTQRPLYLVSQLHAETRAVHLFLEQADKLGIPTPIDYAALRHHERVTNALMSAVEQDKLVTLDEAFPHPDLLAGFALAQHHRIPTRLLDWTESPLIAAYFAAEHASTALGFTPEHDRIAVICLHSSWAGLDSDVRHAASPRHGNTFLRAQQGMFTYHPFANKYFVDHGRWPSIEEVREVERREHPGRSYRFHR